MAGRGMKGWTDAKAQAQKIIGKEGKLPKPRVSLDAAMEAANKQSAQLAKLRDGMETQLVAVMDANSNVRHAAESYNDLVGGADFDLDPKSADGKKKISDAQKILSDQLEEIEKLADEVNKIIGDLNKSLANLSKQIQAAG